MEEEGDTSEEAIPEVQQEVRGLSSGSFPVGTERS